MKDFVKIILLLFLCGAYQEAFAENKAEIKFEKRTHNFGTLPANNPYASCYFVFTNVGNAPLIINQAMASCGCAVPSYPKEPIAPGESDTIKVSYNGRGMSGHFRKVITVRTNAKESLTRLIVEGDIPRIKKK